MLQAIRPVQARTHSKHRATTIAFMAMDHALWEALAAHLSVIPGHLPCGTFGWQVKLSSQVYHSRFMLSANMKPRTSTASPFHWLRMYTCITTASCMPPRMVMRPGIA